MPHPIYRFRFILTALSTSIPIFFFFPRSTQLNESDIKQLASDYTANQQPELKTSALKLWQMVKSREHYYNQEYFHDYSAFSKDMHSRLCQSEDWTLPTEVKISVFETHRIQLNRSIRIHSDSKTKDMIADASLFSAERFKDWLETSFNNWKQSPYEPEISFDTYSQGLLPHYCLDEALEDWRQVSSDKFTDLLKEIGSQKDLYTAYAKARSVLDRRILSLSNPDLARLPRDTRLSSLATLSHGNCYDETVFQTLIMRTANIPTAPHYVPSWGNRKVGAHAWAGLVGYDHPRKIDNKNSGKNTNTTVGASSFDTDWTFSPNDLDRFTYNKFVPKVFRKRYIGISELAPEEQNTIAKISRFFDDSKFIDVTDQHVSTIDIKIQNPNEYNKNQPHYFLGLFNRTKWHPIAHSKRNSLNVEFKNVGINIVYILMQLKDGTIKPVGNPFLATTDGLRFFNPDKLSRSDIKIERKNPLFANTATHYNTLRHTHVELSNSQDFENRIKIGPINLDFRDTNLLKIPTNNSFRYIRFSCSLQNDPIHIAEIEFIHKGNSTSQPNGSTEPTPNNNNQRMQDALFDRKLESYREVKPGEVFEVSVPTGSTLSGIRIHSRSDTNFIEPGKTYELRVYNEDWQIFDRVKSNDYHVTFENVPQEGLYWVKCIEGGVEERPFAISGDRQIFY